MRTKKNNKKIRINSKPYLPKWMMTFSSNTRKKYKKTQFSETSEDKFLRRNKCHNNSSTWPNY